MNYSVTFESARAHRIALPRFLLVAALGLFVNGIVMATLTETTDLNYLLVQVIATGVVLLIGFWANRRWTF